MVSTLDTDNALRPADEAPRGHDVRTLGPSDSSDSGSDLIGAGPVEEFLPLDRGTNEDSGSNDYSPGLDDSSDRHGTGTRASAGESPDTRAPTDIDTDRIVTAAEAGLGGGLDEAEEARLGMTDEELEAALTDDDCAAVPKKPARRTPRASK